jgi:amino acid adenylation domain-containing protein
MPQSKYLDQPLVETQPGSIPEAFAQCVRRHPERTALLLADRSLSYRALEERADAIARRLAAAGVGRGDIVGLHLPRGEQAICAMLGVVKVGAAYLPFDASYPAKLLRYIYEDSLPKAMLVEFRAADGASIFWDGPALSLDSLADDGELPGLPAAHAPLGPDDLAYVMYTSGSTGRPKGVMIPQRGVLRLVIGNHYAELDEDEVILQLAPLSFDASTFEIWGALLNGGRLAILAEPHPSLDEIAAAIARHGVTTLWLTAGLFHLMVDHRLDGLKPLRQLLAGGDVLSPLHVGRALGALPRCRLINGYGPTENTTFTCCHTIAAADCRPGPIPIGRPIARTEVHVLDEAMRPVAGSGEGELYIGGAGLALGYLNRPDLTAERFVVDPFARQPGARLYRTGDRVRRRADGSLEFLGRFDRQLKINGKRVELEEVEACLRRSPLVADAAAVAGPAANGQARIAAYVAPVAGADAAGLADRLRAFLVEELPDHMMPASISLLDTLPLSPMGKIDRAKLPPPHSAVGAPPRDARPPRDKVEVALLAIWGQVLGREDIGLDDNFFDLGGNSLQLTKAHALITASLDRRLTIVDMFSYPRISALASRIVAQPESRRSALSAKDRAQRQGLAFHRAQRQVASLG